MGEVERFKEGATGQGPLRLPEAGVGGEADPSIEHVGGSSLRGLNLKPS